MSSITFDKLAYIDSLKVAGIPENQARAHAGALNDALHDTVATQADLRETELRLERKIDLVERDLKIWFGKMMAWQLTAIAGLLAIATAAMKLL
ncbi:MAG: hypothetical protein WCF85_16195 [Rhodospirillaceae bacterium]